MLCFFSSGLWGKTSSCLIMGVTRVSTYISDSVWSPRLTRPIWMILGSQWETAPCPVLQRNSCFACTAGVCWMLYTHVVGVWDKCRQLRYFKLFLEVFFKLFSHMVILNVVLLKPTQGKHLLRWKRFSLLFFICREYSIRPFKTCTRRGGVFFQAFDVLSIRSSKLKMVKYIDCRAYQFTGCRFSLINDVFFN